MLNRSFARHMMDKAISLRKFLLSVLNATTKLPGVGLHHVGRRCELLHCALLGSASIAVGLLAVQGKPGVQNFSMASIDPDDETIPVGDYIVPKDGEGMVHIPHMVLFIQY